MMKNLKQLSKKLCYEWICNFRYPKWGFWADNDKDFQNKRQDILDQLRVLISFGQSQTP